MYCKKCGKEINEKENFCSHCGTPVNQSGLITPIIGPYIANSKSIFESFPAKIFAIICSFLIGLAMIGGAIYGMIFLSSYTKFIYIGGIATILGGILCIMAGVSLIIKLRNNKKNVENEKIS